MSLEIISKNQIKLKIKQQDDVKTAEWDLYFDHIIVGLVQWANNRLEETVRLNSSIPTFSQEINYKFLNTLTHRNPPYYNKNGMHLIISELKHKVDASPDWVLLVKNIRVDTVKITFKERKHKILNSKIFKR